MEASTQEGLGTAESKSKPKGDPKEPTQYVVLVRWEPLEDEDDGPVEGEFYELLTDESGEAPIVAEAHRREDVLADLISENRLHVEEDGRTPYVAIVPARSFKPLRATVTRKPTVKFD